MTIYKITRFIARALAFPINRRSISIELFRRIRFKGKLTISEFLSDSIFPPNGLAQCRGLLFDLDLSEYIQRHIYLDLYEYREIDLVYRLLRPGDCCVDIGANIGYFTLHMAQAVGRKGKVFALEPDPKINILLRRNVELNEFSDTVVVVECGISSQRGTVGFSEAADSNRGVGQVVEIDEKQTGTIRVTTLDHFVDDYGISEISLLKCDIEAHELEMLKGAEKTLASHVINRILIEYCGYTLDRQGHAVREYIELFATYGYRLAPFNQDLVHNHRKYSTYNLLFERDTN